MMSLISTPIPATTRPLQALLVLRILMALFFLFLAGKNLSGDVTMATDFQRWGYSDGFRMLTAVLQILGAVLLLWPQTIFLGAVCLTLILVGATLTHFRYDPPAAMITPLAFLLPMLIFAWVHRPVGLFGSLGNSQ